MERREFLQWRQDDPDLFLHVLLLLCSLSFCLLVCVDKKQRTQAIFLWSLLHFCYSAVSTEPVSSPCVHIVCMFISELVKILNDH